MTQKRILRAQARSAARERDLLLRDAFRAHWADIDDPEVVTLVSRLSQDDPDVTAIELFDMVNQLMDELTEVSGESREAVLARIQRPR